MIDRCLRYFLDRILEIPMSVGISLLVVFCVGTVLLMALKRGMKGMKWSAGLILLEYAFLLLYLTLFVRSVLAERMSIIMPFRSYRAILVRDKELLVESLANVVAFIPIGLLLGISFPNIKWWKVLLIGGAFSLFIETLQFISKRGFAESDDVFHNVLGGMIGYGMYMGVRWMVKMMRGKKMMDKE